jgi:hypothetical protein
MTLKVETILLTITVAATLTGCAVRTPHEGTSAFIDRSYVDLEPGWRIRVVSPILKSATFKVQTEEAPTSGATIALKTTDDFVGFETDYYAVNAPNGHGSLIEFSSAEVKRNGRRIKRPQPLLPLFEFPERVHYVRLLFLTRVSKTEHDQAILGASSLAELDTLTRRVEASPVENCKMQPEGICSWVPSGISVQPEKRTAETGKTWIPAS